MFSAIRSIFQLLVRFFPAIRGWFTGIIRWLTKGKWRYLFAYFLIDLTGSLIKRLFLFLGVTLVTTHFAVPMMRPYLVNALSGIGSPWINFFAILRIDQALTVILSAIAIKAASSISFSDTKYPERWVS